MGMGCGRYRQQLCIQDEGGGKGQNIPTSGEKKRSLSLTTGGLPGLPWRADLGHCANIMTTQKNHNLDHLMNKVKWENISGKNEIMFVRQRHNQKIFEKKIGTRKIL